LITYQNEKIQQMQIGIMQGRLSDQIGKKIQAFPWMNWKSEFSISQKLHIPFIEWTLDQDRLYQNPIMTTEGQKDILAIVAKTKVSIPSLTGDCFMQAPFFKADSSKQQELINDFCAIVIGASIIGARTIVFPLVDAGSVENKHQESIVINSLINLNDFLVEKGMQIAFESDYGPQELAKFIEKFPSTSFGINYDTGNSAALGYSPMEELASYGNRVINVHIKDRIYGGATVALGEGDTDFEVIFETLLKMSYRKNFVIQAARALDGNHEMAVENYLLYIKECWAKIGSQT